MTPHCHEWGVEMSKVMQVELWNTLEWNTQHIICISWQDPTTSEEGDFGVSSEKLTQSVLKLQLTTSTSTSNITFSSECQMLGRKTSQKLVTKLNLLQWIILHTGSFGLQISKCSPAETISLEHTGLVSYLRLRALDPKPLTRDLVWKFCRPDRRWRYFAQLSSNRKQCWISCSKVTEDRRQVFIWFKVSKFFLGNIGIQVAACSWRFLQTSSGGPW